LADDRVLFTIEAENQQLKAKLAETEAELNKLKTTAASVSADMTKGMDATAASTAKAAGGFGELAKGIRGSISQVTAFVGSMTAALGVVTAFYTIGQKLSDLLPRLFAGSGGPAKEFVESLDLTDSKKSLELVRKEMEQLQNRKQKILSGGSLNLGLGADQTELDSIERQLRILEPRQKNLAGAVNAPVLRAREAKRIELEAAREADKLRKDLENAASEGKRRAEEAQDAQRAEEAFARIVDQVNAEYDRRLERGKEVEDDLHAKRMQLMEAEARHFAEAYEKAIDQINRANATFFNNFADKQNGLLLSIRQEITRIRGSIPSSGGAAGFGSGGSY